MNKILTVLVPVYNTEQYLSKCLDSLIVEQPLMETLEVLVVIDGSPDNSLAIALQYAEKYTGTFKVINKENGGHGSTINKGIELATGKYFKVLDSDDWFEKDCFKIFLQKITQTDADIVLTDFVEERVFENTSKLIPLQEMIPNKLYNNRNIDYVKEGYNICSMARSAYKTELLRSNKILLPEKMPNDDEVLAITPLFYSESTLYLKVPLYRYLLGRSEQTMDKENFFKNRLLRLSVIEALISYFEKEYNYLKKRGDENLITFFKKHLTSVYLGHYFMVIKRLPYGQAKLELKVFVASQKRSAQFCIPNKNFILARVLPFWAYRKLVLWRIKD